MKTILSLVFATLFASLLFTGCKKGDPNATFQVSFFTSKANGPLSLYVDGTYKGVLPYFAQTPACGNPNTDGQLPITMVLKSGKYTIEGKDSLGRITSSGTIKISSCTMGTFGNLGGQSLSNTGDCVIVGLFE